MNVVLEALSLLVPYDIDIPKRRFGPNTDGGYVFADRISPSQSIVSYGISTEYRFDVEMALAGHKVYMFDHTIGGIDKINDNMMWFKEGVAGTSRPDENLFSIADHLANHRIEGDRLILKMDVEGHEYEAFASLPDDVLARFEQVVIEIHNLAHLNDPPFRDTFTKALRKLNYHFTLFHVHANNYDGPDAYHIVGGFPVSNLLELSYIKTGLVRRRRSMTLYPTAFDYPNTGHKDKLLWMFPFLPTPVNLSDFGACEERVALLSRG